MRVNKDKERLLTVEDVWNLLEYDTLTGGFIWRNPVSRRTKQGEKAGSLSKNGYVYIKIKGRAYLAHRVAWLYVKGVWPKELIDHRDRNRGNNAFHNLREASFQFNSFNSLPFVAPRESGLTGVTPSGTGWRARIWIKRKAVNLGWFESKEKAAEAHRRYILNHQQSFCYLLSNLRMARKESPDAI